MKENFILTVHFYPSGTMFLDIDATREEAKEIAQQMARTWHDVSVAVTAHQQTSPQIKEWYLATARTYCLVRDRKPLELYIQALRAARERQEMFKAGKAGDY
jgi:DNA-binding NarL/FixJ family response regulator